MIGSRGIKYNVCISKEPKCTCPDFKERRGRCKHQILCLIKECGCTADDINLSDSKYIDIKNILSDDDELQPKLDCECPICFETLHDVKTNIQCVHCTYSEFTVYIYIYIYSVRTVCTAYTLY